nr:hypothetical protein Pyn_06004 [Ipomoea batatas]
MSRHGLFWVHSSRVNDHPPHNAFITFINLHCIQFWLSFNFQAKVPIKDFGIDVIAASIINGTDEVRRWLFATGVKQQAERDRNVEIDPKNVSFQGGAKADSRLEIQETAEGRAAMRIRRVSDHRANTSVQ